MMIEPNWEYLVDAPLDSGTTKFGSKIERALHARVIASAENWFESKTLERLMIWLESRKDLEAFLGGLDTHF
mgnify:FL=1